MDAALQLAVDRRPRIELTVPAGAEASADRLRLRRAVRALVGQRGGVMLLSLASVPAEVRLECECAGPNAAFVLATDDDGAAALLRASLELVRTECARLGVQVERIACAGPAPRPLAA